MTTVVDASALVAAMAADGEDGRWAEEIIGRGALAAPHLVLAEASNILRRLELGERLTPFETASALEDLLALDIELLPFEPFAYRVWELRPNLTTYDGWYVAVAEAFDAPLATLDRRLTRAPGPSCSFLSPS